MAVYLKIITHSLIQSLRSLILFEDLNEDFDLVVHHDEFSNEWFFHPELVRTPSPAVGLALASRNAAMTTLSASYLVDARNFFSVTARGLMKYQTWDILKSVALSSLVLREESHPDDVTAMLVDAGITAQQMPCLNLMEIWYGTRNTACVFRYCVIEGDSEIRWHGTWSHNLAQSEIFEAWQRVAQIHNRT